VASTRKGRERVRGDGVAGERASHAADAGFNVPAAGGARRGAIGGANCRRRSGGGGRGGGKDRRVGSIRVNSDGEAAGAYTRSLHS